MSVPCFPPNTLQLSRDKYSHIYMRIFCLDSAAMCEYLSRLSCRVLLVYIILLQGARLWRPGRATRAASDTIFCTVVGSRASKVPYEHCRVVAVSGAAGRLRRACNCSVEACDSTGVSGLSPYVAAVAADCLGMPSTRCSASHRATHSYTAATARPPALRHEHTSLSPPHSLRSLSRSVWMHLGRAS